MGSSGSPGLLPVAADPPLVQLDDRLAMVDYAVARLKRAGFELAYASMKSEACYYRFPGRDGVIRVAAHRYGGAADYAVTLPVFACLTFGRQMRPRSDAALETVVALAVGRYFLAGESTASWRKAEVRRQARKEMADGE